MSDAPQPPERSSRLLRLQGRPRALAIWAATRLATVFDRLSGHRASAGFGILTYHRVAEPVAGLEPPTWSVTPAQLRNQLMGLLARGFEPWSLTKLVEFRRAELYIPSNAFAVTFDDGYENNYTQALPILRELNVPVTIFLATQYLDSDRPFPFDDWSATGSPQVPTESWHALSTDQCHALLSSGLVEFGAHTHSHQRFVGRCDEFRQDLATCLDVLRQRFGIVRPAFAFPYGASSAELIATARQAGVSCCLSTRTARIHVGQDEFQWGRFGVEANDAADVLAAKLTGWYTSVSQAAKTIARPLSVLTAPAVRRQPLGHEQLV